MGYRAVVTTSKRAGKKYTVVVYLNNKKVKTLHIGEKGANDFTKTGDTRAKAKYLKRHENNERWDKGGITTAGFWARHLLWNKRTLQSSARDTARRFGISVNVPQKKSLADPQESTPEPVEPDEQSMLEDTERIQDEQRRQVVGEAMEDIVRGVEEGDRVSTRLQEKQRRLDEFRQEEGRRNLIEQRRLEELGRKPTTTQTDLKNVQPRRSAEDIAKEDEDVLGQILGDEDGEGAEGKKPEKKPKAYPADRLIRRIDRVLEIKDDEKMEKAFTTIDISKDRLGATPLEVLQEVGWERLKHLSFKKAIPKEIRDVLKREAKERERAGGLARSIEIVEEDEPTSVATDMKEVEASAESGSAQEAMAELHSAMGDMTAKEREAMGKLHSAIGMKEVEPSAESGAAQEELSPDYVKSLSTVDLTILSSKIRNKISELIMRNTYEQTKDEIEKLRNHMKQIDNELESKTELSGRPKRKKKKKKIGKK